MTIEFVITILSVVSAIAGLGIIIIHYEYAKRHNLEQPWMCV